MKRLETFHLNRKFNATPVPTVALLELTHQCNLACFHCIRDCPTAPKPDFMTTEMWMKVLDDLARLKAMAVVLTGGEATLHKDLMLLVHRAREIGLAVSLKTNALKLDRIAQPLRDAGVLRLEISLHGATAATHERCSRVEGSFERAVAGIRAARQAGLPVTINANVFRWSMHELLELRALGESLGCSVGRDYNLLHTDCGRHFEEDWCTPEQIRRIEEAWPGATIVSNQNQDPRPRVCTQGVNGCAVTADGEILSCVQVRKPIAHIREKSLYDAWLAESGHSHAIDYERFDRCSKCAYLPKCNVCIGQNHAATGSFYEPPLERCYATMALYGDPVHEKRYAQAGTGH